MSAPTSWFWDFGDGATSTAQNPTHTYAAAGNYTVSLTATNAGGSNTKTRVAYIVVARNVTIPEPGTPLLCGPAITGQVITGQTIGADTYQDFALALPTETPALKLDEVVQVAMTGYLDLLAETAVLTVERNLTIVCVDSPLELDADPATVLIELDAVIVVEDGLALDLDGGPVRVNPVLMPVACDEIDLTEIVRTDEDLTALLCEALDLVPIDCVEA